MLIQFSVKNYKIFKDLNTLSLVASNYDKSYLEENSFPNRKFKFRFLKSAVLYGANASGKSKFFEAYHTFRNIIFNSSKESLAEDKINVTPFLLDLKSEKEPTSFEIIFLSKDIQYRYGFEATSQKITKEWLFSKESVKEEEIFYRVNQKIEANNSIEIAKDLIQRKMVRNNALFLSVLSQFNNKIARNLISNLRNTNSISGIEHEGYEGFTIHQVEKEKDVRKEDIINFLNVADFGIEDLKVNRLDTNNLPAEMPDSLKDAIRKAANGRDRDKYNFYEDISTLRRKYSGVNPLNETVAFSMDEDESSGTRKYFALSGPILDTLKSGSTLFVDELDSQLHPLLVRHLVRIFHSKKTNPRNAQLVFNTHDINLLNSGLFRRDQVWFTEKDSFGIAKLFSLADIKSENDKKIRNDENYERNYIQGKYGAIPYINNLDLVK